MRSRLVAFLFLLTTLLGIWFWYIGDRLIANLPSNWAEAAVVWAILAVPFISILILPVVFWHMRRHEEEISRDFFLIRVGYLSFGFLSILFTVLVSIDLLELVLGKVSEAASHSTRGTPLPLIVTGILFAYGLVESRRVPRVTKVELPVDSLPPALQGFKIAQVSDLHIGPNIRKNFVEKVVGRVNELGADVIAVTGDLIDGTVESLKEDFAPLKQLKARRGIFFVTGNHEYYSGVEPWLKEIDKVGWITLSNSSHLIEENGGRILVAGVPDYTAASFGQPGPKDPKELLQDAPAADFRVLLAHQPKIAPLTARTDFNLQLSGHTHSGQFIPWVFFIRLFHPAWRGLHKIKKLWVYVNRGTGTWGPPLRVGSASEITLFTLVERRKPLQVQ